MKPIRVLICGSRTWKDEKPIEACIRALSEGSVIIEGGAKGADIIAGNIGTLLELDVQEYVANWDKYGKSAGPIRNRQMLTDGKPDVVVYFHRNLRDSKGTRDMVKASCDAGIPVLNGCAIIDWTDAFETFLEVKSPMIQHKRNV